MKQTLLKLAMILVVAMFSGTGCRDYIMPDAHARGNDRPQRGRIDGTPGEHTTELTIVTYNVANLGRGGKDRTGDVADFLKKAGADYVGLNELDSCNNRHSAYQLKDLAERMGSWSYHYASAFDFAGGGYGNGAMCAGPMLDAYTLRLARGSGHEPRTVAVIETSDIVFGATHLDFGPPGEPSLEQAKAINAWVTERYKGYGKPVILVGDFNTDPGTDTQDEMEKLWTRLSDPVLSWPSDEPEMCLDYVYCYKEAVQVEAIETSLPEGMADYKAVSDHNPVRVKIRFRDKNDKSAVRKPEPAEVNIESATAYGPAAGNVSAAAGITMQNAIDAEGNPLKNIFETYLDPAGGPLAIKAGGMSWSLQEGGKLAPGGIGTLPASDAMVTLLRLDFGQGKWEAIGIKSVCLQPYQSDAKPIPLLWKGKGIFEGSEFFCPENGYTRYFYKLESDSPEAPYAWVRGKGGKLVPVDESGCTGSVIFGAEPSLNKKKLVPIINIYEASQTLMVDKRDLSAILIGDSITELWGRNESAFFAANNYLGKGISGQTSTTIRNRFAKDVVALKPYVVHIMCGTNDVAENDGSYVESSAVVENITAMAQMARQERIKVVIGSVFPCNFFSWRGTAWKPAKEGVTIASHIFEINSLLKEYCEANDIPFIDYYSVFVNPADYSFPLSYDGCHPGAEALKKMNEMVKPVIEAQLQ